MRKDQLERDRQAVRAEMDAAVRCRQRDARQSDQCIKSMLEARRKHDELCDTIKKQVVASMRQQKRMSGNQCDREILS